VLLISQDQLKSSRFAIQDPADPDSGVEMINFDYHAECRAGKASNVTKLMGEKIIINKARFCFFAH